MQDPPVGPVHWAVATTTGDRVAYLDHQGAAHLLDVATRTARPLWPGHRASDLALADDGSWIALADQSTVVILDGMGGQLAAHPDQAVRLFGSRFGDVGYATSDKVVLCKLSPRPASSRPPLVSADGQLILSESINGHLVATETATHAAWDLPAYYSSFDLVTIAPTTRRFVQSGFGYMALWTLPLAPPDLRSWLDERTNATTNSDHALIWPWQPSRR